MENQINFCSRIWHFLTTQVNWVAWITLGAVLVALYPIIRDHKRKKAQARSLRLRFGSLLFKIRPSLGSSILPNGHPNIIPEAVLSKEDFQEVVRNLGILLDQGSILEADEIDHLGVTYMHLVLTSQLYKTDKFDAEMATNGLKFVDKAFDLMSNHGLITTKIDKPWEKSG